MKTLGLTILISTIMALIIFFVGYWIEYVISIDGSFLLLVSPAIVFFGWWLAVIIME